MRGPWAEPRNVGGRRLGFVQAVVTPHLRSGLCFFKPAVGLARLHHPLNDAVGLFLRHGGFALRHRNAAFEHRLQPHLGAGHDGVRRADAGRVRRRPIGSNTPLQALTLLNDPTFVEAAKTFGARILSSGEPGDAKRLDFAFSRSFFPQRRPPRAGSLTGIARTTKAILQEQAIPGGRLARDRNFEGPPILETAEPAAWTTIARALLNKHEFVMRY